MEVGTILFKKDTASTKNPKNIKRNVFIIYSPRHIKVEPASFRRIDTEILVFLPDNSRGFITSTFTGDELKEIFDGKHRLWIEKLNRPFEDNIVIKKNKPLGFLVVKLGNLKFKYVPTKKRTKQKRRRTTQYKRKKQLGGFLNTFDFGYAGRDTVNEVGKIAPGVVKGTTDKINSIAEQRINQLIPQSGKDVKRILPKVFRGAIEDVYEMFFRLLGHFGKNQFNKLK